MIALALPAGAMTPSSLLLPLMLDKAAVQGRFTLITLPSMHVLRCQSSKHSICGETLAIREAASMKERIRGRKGCVTIMLHIGTG